jgi:pyruvate/2-oxoacid:ferredoxin oxidoreductase alpha subunit
MEMRYSLQQAMEEALHRFVEMETIFEKSFGRRYGPVEAIDCEEAEIILVTSGTVTSTGRQLLQDLQLQGEKTGLLKVKMFRPFPSELIRKHLGSAKKVAVIDRNFSFGASGIFAQEIRAALCRLPDRPIVFGYIAGLGGRDVTLNTLAEIYQITKNQECPIQESLWVGLQEVSHGYQPA